MFRNKKAILTIFSLIALLLVVECTAFALTRWQSQPKPTINSRSS